MINYLIAGFIVAYAVLVGWTIILYHLTEVGEVPKKGSKAYPIYMHGWIWFNVLWIAFAFALGSIIVDWFAGRLGGM